MDRKLDNVILTILVIAIIILMGVTYKTCQFIKENDYKPSDVESAEIPSTDVDHEDQDIIETKEADLADEDERKLNEEIEYVKTVDEPSSPAVDETQSKTKKAEAPISSSNSEANFLLIAGTYSSKGNADSQFKKLEKLGYNPEIIQFANSTYHTVCVARFEDKSTAKAMSAKLKKNHKINSYIHTKQE